MCGHPVKIFDDVLDRGLGRQEEVEHCDEEFLVAAVGEDRLEAGCSCIRNRRAGQSVKSWPVADKRLTINEKNICLVEVSVPDICPSTSLSRGYPPRLKGPAEVG